MKSWDSEPPDQLGGTLTRPVAVGVLIGTRRTRRSGGSLLEGESFPEEVPGHALAHSLGRLVTVAKDDDDRVLAREAGEQRIEPR